MKQKAQITFEQHETLVLKQSGSHVLEFCPKCGDEVLFVTPEILAAMTESSERDVFRLVEAGVIQFVERNRTYACSQCYRNSVGQTPLIPATSVIKKLGE